MLSEPTLRLLEVAGQWFSGFCAMAAVVVALYLARKQEAVRLRAEVWSTGSDNVQVRVVNHGNGPVTISELSWQFGLLRKQYMCQSPPQSGGNWIPIELKAGRQAIFNFPLKGWLPVTASEISGPFAWLRVWTMRVVVFTAVGPTVSKRIEKRLRRKLLEDLDRENSNGSGNTEPVDAA